MSVRRTEVSSVRFEINARPASASMEALQEEAKKLKDRMEDVNKQIEALGKVEPDDQRLIGFRKELKNLKSDLDDVNRTMKDYTRGVKAADELLKAYDAGNIESLSMKAIKAGQNGLKKRIENIKPETANEEELKAYRIITEVIRESQRVVDTFKTDARETIQILEQGGTVAESTLKKTRDGVRDLMQTTKEGSKENREYAQQFEFLAEKMKEMETESARVSGQKMLGRAFRGDFATADTKTLNEVIAKLREYQTVIDDPNGKGARIMDATEKQIRSLSETLNEIKNNGALKLMNERMGNLGNLSKDALAETKRFWQAMYDGADQNDPKLAEIEKRLKDINAEEQKRDKGQLQKDARLIKTADLSTLSEQELQGSIRAAKQLAQAMDPADASYKQLVADIIRAEEHVEKFGLAGETSTQKQVQQLQQMVDRMASLSNLSDAALQETKKFWEAQVAGTEKGKAELAEYEARLKAVKDEEQERNRIANEQKAGIVRSESFNMYSLAEIRESIAAAKELHSHMASASPDAQRLAESIAKAEEHVKRYGGEAARVAQSNETMRRQFQTMIDELNRGIMPTASAIKAQQNYWRKLIEDPKTAKESLQEYRDQLKEVDKMQEAMVKINGETAFQWFQNGSYKDASTNKVKEMAADLKAYRDSLPQETAAARIQQIDQWLQKTGQSAKKAAEDVMSLDDALELAAKAGENYYLQNNKEGFVASPQQIQAATKAINERRDAVIKLIQENKRLGLSTEAEEEELADLTKKLRDLKFEQDNVNMSQEKMRRLMEQPAQAVSLDELRAAIKRADGELRRMEGSLGKNSKEYNAFAEQVKAAKNTLKDMEGAAKASASAWEKAVSRLKTYVGLYMGFNILWQKVTGTASDLLDLSDRMGEVRKTTQMTADQVGRLSDALTKLDTRTSLTGLMEFSSLAGSIGLKTQEDVQGFTEAANMLSVSLPELGSEASRTLMKIADATGDLEKNGNNVRETLERVGSTVIALRANSAAAAGPITDFVSRVGAVGAQAGISIDQIAALGATVDALGGRVEMSATALSRMIPAIRNNTFEVAQAIGMTEKQLKSMSGIDQMVAVFKALHDSVKNFDMTTEEGMNAAADAVEGMLGRSVSMQDVMKQLNQQGARAGIVFGLLSQNVDTLEKQLGIAGEAYKQNTALMDEYNKMNDTAAAKWERLKNQMEEAFVSDTMQKGLGWMIDGLRKTIDLLVGSGGVSVALRTVITFLMLTKANLWGVFASMKGIEGGLQKIGIAIGFVNNETKKLQWGNIFTALAGAVLYAVHAFGSYRERLSETQKEIGKWAQELVKSEQAVNDNFKAVDKANDSINEANKKVREAKAALEAAKKQMDGSKESADRLAKAEEDLKKAEDDVRKASDAHKSSIENINKIYGKYLGFMLSEISSANELANARELINAKLRETITLKRKEAALGRIEENYGEGRDKKYGELSQALGISKRKKVKVGNKEVWTTDTEASTELLREITTMAQGEKLTAQQVEQVLSDAGLSIYETTSNGKKKVTAYGAYLRNLVMDYRKEYLDVQKKVKDTEMQFDVEASVDRKHTQKELKEQYRESEKTYVDLEGKYAAATGEARKKAAATLLKQADTLEGMIAAAPNYYDLSNDKEKEAYENFVKDAQARIDGIKDQRDALVKEAGSYYSSGNGGGGGGGGKNPYGDYNKVTSPYKEWNGNDLVARRKEMLERVKALANGADVQAVLSEDARFIKDAVRKNIKTTEQAIEWYNTERLKIQDALHAKHLTNTGDWMDPEKVRKRVGRVVNDEMKYYLDELDAYYTERKAKIQEAQNDQEISEAEARNRTLANDAEWQQRRAELQLLYSKRRGEVVQQEQDEIFRIISERTGETTAYIKADIAQTNHLIEETGKKNKAAMDRIYGDIELGAERSFLRQRNAIGQHMKDITAIVNKENPYAGITEELRKNLGTMDALLTDIEKEEERTMEKEIERTMFILEQSTKGYSLTWEQLMGEMAKRGWQAWADAIDGDAQTQQRLMHQVYRVFEKVQDAIKKEASELKKQADIMWSNILLPGGDGKTTIKDAFEQAIGALGIQEGRVSRANSLIGAGVASERVADKLAIQQLKVQLAMQQYQYSLVHKIGKEKIDMLRREAEMESDAEKARQLRMQAQNAEMALNLATRKEQTDELKLQEDIIAKTEESEARLYKELREWADLLTSSIQGVFEASHAGDAEYYNERAKLDLTGKGGPGAGTYVVIDNAGTSDATAHYEYLDERQALEREHEIEQQNAQAEAWRKLMDDINQKMSDQITDWLNAMFQNASLDANTDATLQNTEALMGLSGAIAGAKAGNALDNIDLGGTTDGSASGAGATAGIESGLTPDQAQEFIEGMGDNPMLFWQEQSDIATQKMLDNMAALKKGQDDANKKMQASTQATFAKMTAAANMYGIAYQTMSNDNLSTTQKFEMMAVQAAGQSAISMLTVDFSTMTGEAAVNSASVLGKLWSQLGWYAIPVYALFTGLLGGLMGLAVSKIAKSKSQIAQVTGASVGAGRLATGMLTYAEGNVNEFTDPASLTPGRQYNVDGADGKTYRARYMGKDAKTHITNGPEFHLVGEKGREAIIDAHTTRLMQTDDTGIWQAIQTLYNGGRVSGFSTRRGRGVRAFAEGNINDFEDISGSGMEGADGFDDLTAMQDSLDRNTAVQEALLERLNKPIVAQNIWTGPEGIPNMVNKYQKEAKRHGVKYL